MRAANGLDPFRAFLEALRRCPPGTEHELVLALKGFADEHEAEPYLSIARDLDAQPLLLADVGYDLGAYFAAASKLSRTRYCFVNSFSEPLVEGWLAMLDDALGLEGVGMVSATGSWNSSRSWALHALGIRTPYRGLLPSRRVMHEEFAALGLERDAGDGSSSEAAVRVEPHRRTIAGSALVRLPRSAIRILPEFPVQIRCYEPFPAHHLRTNAFAIEHSTLATLRQPEIQDKSDAYRLESGRDSLTRQVQRLGMRAVVVDRHGETFEQDEWHRSLTLWQRSQEGLMVADNQTRSYERGSAARKQMMSVMAWGPCAEPAPVR